MTLKIKILPSFVTLFMILVVGFFSNVISKWLISSAYFSITALNTYRVTLNNHKHAIFDLTYLPDEFVLFKTRLKK